MELEVLLSVMNIKRKDLSGMNITSKCTVVNQSSRNKKDSKYKNFNIYTFVEVGLSNSRNRGLEKVRGDIILLCDDDVVYNEDYEKIVLEEFEKNKDADVILFNLESPYRKRKIIKKDKKLHLYNSLGYSSSSIAFRRRSIMKKRIVFNQLFGAGSLYTSGEDTLFLVDCLKNKLNVYLSSKYIGVVNHLTSTWFNGYNEKYFFDKGALYTAINLKFRKIYMLQYLFRHKYVLNELSFFKAYKMMKRGSKDYLKRVKFYE